MSNLPPNCPNNRLRSSDRHQRVGAQVQEPAADRGGLCESQETLHLALQELGDEPDPAPPGSPELRASSLSPDPRRPRWATPDRAAAGGCRQHLRGALPVGLGTVACAVPCRDDLAERRQRRRRIERHHALGAEIGQRCIGRRLPPLPQAEVGGGRPGPVRAVERRVRPAERWRTRSWPARASPSTAEADE